MNFGALCDVFEQLRSCKVPAEKKNLLQKLFQSLRQKNQDFFPLLRLIVPKLDRERSSYRIKESKISKLLIKMLDLPQCNDKITLTKCSTCPGADFGDILYSILRKYIVNQKTLITTNNINTYLDQIATRKTDSILDDLMLNIFKKLSARDTKWFIQLILKELKLGVNDATILNVFHNDASNFYSTNNNLKKVCEVLSNPEVKLNELEINVFEPFRPMLSKRCDAKNFKKCFPDSKSFYIENKFDGERFQIHMKNDQFKYFSRNGFDFTQSYGENFNTGNLTPFLKNAFDPALKQVILDGEMMLWNQNTQTFGSKGMNLDVKKLKGGKYKPCFCVFDILLMNEQILTNQPLSRRVKCLRKYVKTIPGTLHLSEILEAKSKQDIIDALNASIDLNEEGIVIKDPSSVYKYSDRNSGWFKLKMDYFDDVVHDLDVLIMGGNYSGSKINSFFIGICSGPGIFYCLGKIASGLNAEQLDLLNNKLQTKGVKFSNFPDKSLRKLFFGRETPDVFIEPENSCVLTIRASELVRSTDDSVKTPYTLRFPRVLAIRDDKNPDECLTMNELLEFTSHNKAVIKLNKRHLDLNEIMSERMKRKAKPEIITGKLHKTSKLGDFLKGKKLHVLTGAENWPIDEIYYSIKRFGGEACYQLNDNLDIVLTNQIKPELMKKNICFDLIHLDWLKRILESGELLSYKQNEIIRLGVNFKTDLCDNFDQYGDSYSDTVTKDTLKSVFNSMEIRGDFINVNRSIDFNIANNKFENFIAYFDSFSIVNDEGSGQIYYALPDKIRFQYYKGQVSEKLNKDVNLIVTKNYGDRKKVLGDYLEQLNVNFSTKAKIVSRDYVF